MEGFYEIAGLCPKFIIVAIINRRVRPIVEPTLTMTDVANGLGSQQIIEKTPFEKQRDMLIGQITQVKPYKVVCS